MYNRRTPTSASAGYSVGALIKKAVDVLTTGSTYIRIRTNPLSVYRRSTAMTDLIYSFDLGRSCTHFSTSGMTCQALLSRLWYNKGNRLGSYSVANHLKGVFM